jgi:thiamine-phosphate pyrophosphorylase
VLRCAITKGLLPGVAAGAEEDWLVRRGGELASAGVDFLLIRERQLQAAALLRVARRMVRETAGSGMRVVVAGSPDVAREAGAAGVHLGGWRGELRVGDARRRFPEAWVSVSCHSVEDVVRARREGANAVLFAPVFGKVVDGVEVVAGVGLERLRQACAAAAGEVEVFALGGVTEANAAECVAAGASGVAGIRMFFG